MHWLLPWTGTLLRLLITGYGLSDLILENLALASSWPYPTSKPASLLLARHRAFWILLSRVWPRWREACILVKPGTILASHRAGFRSFWRWRSRNSGGRPGIATEIRTLIRRMAVENPGRDHRIYGELLKLGFDLSERTVSLHAKARAHWGKPRTKPPDLAHLPQEPSRCPRRHGLPGGSHLELPAPLHPCPPGPWTPDYPAFQRHRPPHSRMASPTTPGGLPFRYNHPSPHSRPRFNLHQPETVPGRLRDRGEDHPLFVRPGKTERWSG